MTGGDHDTQSDGAQDMEPDEDILSTEFQKDVGGNKETK